MKKLLRDIPPSSPINHAGDSFTIDTIFKGKSLEGNGFTLIPKAYFCNLAVIEFGVFLCASLCLSSLAHHVQTVIGFCAKPEVCGIATSGIVATRTIVKYAQVFWNGAVLQFITVAMHVYILPLNVYASIAKGVGITCPFPAAVGGNLVNIFPKTVFGGASSVMTSNIAVWLTFDPTACFVGERHKLRVFAAAAFAKVCRKFAWSRIAGHDDLQSLCQAAGRFQRRCGASISLFNYSANGRFSQAYGEQQ